MENTYFGVKTTDYMGLKLISSPAMRTPIYGLRTWKERLFSLPFKPFRKFKVVGYKPMEQIVMMGNFLFAAPEIVERLEASLN